LEPSRQTQSLATRGQPDPPTPTVGQSSARRRGRAHRLDQPLKSPAKAVFSSGFGSLRGGSLATLGHRLSAQMAHPAKPEESPQRIPQTILLPPGIAQPKTHRATSGADRQSGGADRRIRFARELHSARASHLQRTPSPAQYH